jgi:acyl-CoA reductase-like NAD-dependent aldehyde dehydrogenase
VQVVTGRGSVIGDYFSGHPGIQILTMTGGTETGIRIAQQTAGNLTRTYLELGGNDAFIVLNDADLDLAVANALESRTNNAGQVCCASKRYIVQKEAAKPFTEKLIRALRGLKVGDPMDRSNDIGSMISRDAAAKVKEQIRATVDAGAELVYGGEVNGSFMTPAVLTGVTPDMPVAKDMEIFGAVFPIIEVDTPEEAVDVANGSSFGLNGAVFSADMALAISVAEKMQTGGIVINGGGNYRTAAMPFGGYKKSGIGREGSSRTLMEYVQEKSYVLKEVFGKISR